MKNAERLAALVGEIESIVEGNPEGSYSHNIVSIILRQIATEFGTKKANAVIDELGLTRLFGISKVQEVA